MGLAIPCAYSCVLNDIYTAQTTNEMVTQGGPPHDPPINDSGRNRTRNQLAVGRIKGLIPVNLIGVCFLKVTN